MLIKVFCLLLCVGVYPSYADDGSESTTEDELFNKLKIFPENFVSRFPQEGVFFRTKIFVYLFFSIFSKYFAENEPVKFWTKFNRNDFNRVAMDSVFYEYLTEFADREMKDLVFNPLESSTSSTEEIAIDRIGDYLDNLSATEVPTEESETRSQATKTIGDKHSVGECAMIPLRDPSFGIPGKDFPNYCDIPQTSFTCSNKLIPGVYADIETGCQVFHACWPNRIDSFLCPIGSTFNQELLTCDFWYESECFSPPQPFDNYLFAKTPRNTKATTDVNDESPSTSTPELDIPEYDGTCQSLVSKPLQLRMKFLPAKCRVRDLKTHTPKTTRKPRKNYNTTGIVRQLARFADALSEVFRDLLVFLIEADVVEDSGFTRIRKVAKLPKLKENQIPKSSSRVVEAATEFLSKHGEIHTMSEEHVHYSTTELPSVNPRFVEKPALKPIVEKCTGRSKPRRFKKTFAGPDKEAGAR